MDEALEPSMEAAVSKLMSGDFGDLEANVKSDDIKTATETSKAEHLDSRESIVSIQATSNGTKAETETSKVGSSGFEVEMESNEQPNEDSNENLTEKFRPNDFVWAKQTKRGVFWPARVAHVSEKTSKRPSEHHVWLYMYDSDSFLWVQEEFIHDFDFEKDEKIEVSSKSKAFKSALEKLEEERLAELSGTSPIHAKVKKSLPSVVTTTRKKAQKPGEAGAPVVMVKATRGKGARGPTVSVEVPDDVDSLSVGSDGTSEIGLTSSQTELKEEDFTLTPDRVLDMLDKQLDMVSSSKYTSTSSQSQSTHPPVSSKKGAHNTGAGASRKRVTGNKTDEPRSKRSVPITCSEFSYDGLQQMESSSTAASNSVQKTDSQNSTKFSLDESPQSSPSKPSSSRSPVVVPSSAHLLNKKGSPHTEVAQIKPIRRTQPFDKNVGFIGVGTIGHSLAELLLKQNFNVYVWNKTPQKCSDLRSLGAKICISAGDVMSRSDITFCCVTDTGSVREVLVGTNGALSEMKRGKSFVNLTTCDPKASTEFYQLVQMRSGRYLEAPMIGSRKESGDGTFLMLAAGDYSLYEDVLPCLEIFSKKRSYVGSAGKACEMQVLMNLLYGNQLAVLAETMALCRKSGVDKQQLLSVLQSSDLASPFLVEKAEMIVGGNESYEPAEKRLSQQQNDLRIALGLSDQLMQAMPITASCNELYKRALSWGDEELDMAVVYKAACL